MYKVILVDDERLALERLERLLAPFSDRLEIVGRAENGADAVTLINSLRPDVIFLDIQMPELNGFDVLARLDYDPPVIFTTAYDQYALKAFDAYSIDYLLKPIDAGRLARAVDKLHRVTDEETAELRDRMAEILTLMEQKETRRIQVKSGNKLKLIAVADIVFFLARDKYTEVHTLSETHLITRSLARLESELPCREFVRVHRSTIVNLDFVSEIRRDLTGGFTVHLKDKFGTKLPVSRRYKSRLELGDI